MDSDYFGRPLPATTEDDVRRAAEDWGDPIGEITTLADRRWVSFARGAGYEVFATSGIDFEKPVDRRGRAGVCSPVSRETAARGPIGDTEARRETKRLKSIVDRPPAG